MQISETEILKFNSIRSTVVGKSHNFPTGLLFHLLGSIRLF